jgi:DNA-binding CsgD family transcriptional regulator
MTPQQLSKLYSAAAPVVAGDALRISASVSNTSGNTRKRPETPGNLRSAPPNDKTKPNAPKTPKPLSARQLVAVKLTICGKTAAAVARQLGVNERTVRVWKSDPRFIGEVQRQLSMGRAVSLETKPPAAAPMAFDDDAFDLDELGEEPDDGEPLSPEYQRIYDNLIAMSRRR